MPPRGRRVPIHRLTQSTVDPKGIYKHLARLITAGVVIAAIPAVILFGGITGVSALALTAALLVGGELAHMTRQHNLPQVALAALPLAVTIGVVIAIPTPPYRDISPTLFEWASLLVSKWPAFWTLPMVGIVTILTVLITVILIGTILAKGLSWKPYLFTLVAVWSGLLLSHAPLLILADHSWRYSGSMQSLPPIHLGSTTYLDGGTALIIIAVLGTLAADAGAFVTSRLIGRHLLAPRISPDKTIEGLVGGVLASAIAVTVLGFILNPLQELRIEGRGYYRGGFELLSEIWVIDLWVWTVLGAAMGLVAAGGGLVIPWLKRRARVRCTGVSLSSYTIFNYLHSLAPNLAFVFWSGVFISDLFWPYGSVSVRGMG